MVPHDEADTLHLHEVYADEAAFDAHNASEHLASYKVSTEHLLLDRSIAWCSVEE
jgi:quinol monooxygenase YgiN